MESSSFHSLFINDLTTSSLLISADLDELIGLSDVIYVMFRGKIVAKLDPNNISARDLGGYMTGSSVQEHQHEN